MGSHRPRVLVACEFSAVVRDAFRARGFDAWSCDLLPTEGNPAFHIQADASLLVDGGWDLMIAHPPCTNLTKAGVRWLHTQAGRRERMVADAKFFRFFLDAPVPRVAVENPVMHRYATEVIGRRQDQVVQPWMFGHLESKGTGFWLKNLPPLVPTDNVRDATMTLTPRERDRVHWAAPGPNRWRLRSRTYTGIAAAMADQWGGLLVDPPAFVTPIDACDVHRPLGADGRHDNLHTPTCDCEEVGAAHQEAADRLARATLGDPSIGMPPLDRGPVAKLLGLVDDQDDSPAGGFEPAGAR